MIQRSFNLGDGTSLAYRATYQTIQSEGHLAFDPTWSEYDENGHYHCTDRGTPLGFPTLKENWYVGYCDTCGDYHEEGELSDGFECRWCGVLVIPGTKYVQPEPIQMITSEEIVREGWIKVSHEEAQRMLVSDEAERLTANISGWHVYIRQSLTKEQAKEYVAKLKEKK